MNNCEVCTCQAEGGHSSVCCRRRLHQLSRVLLFLIFTLTTFSTLAFLPRFHCIKQSFQVRDVTHLRPYELDHTSRYGINFAVLKRRLNYEFHLSLFRLVEWLIPVIYTKKLRCRRGRPRDALSCICNHVNCCVTVEKSHLNETTWQICRSKVISFQTYCPDTQTHRYTDSRWLGGQVVWRWTHDYSMAASSIPGRRG